MKCDFGGHSTTNPLHLSPWRDVGHKKQKIEVHVVLSERYVIAILGLLLKLLFPQAQNKSKIGIKRHLEGLVSSSHDVPVPCCGVVVSPSGLHSFLFCTSCLNIQCAETKLNKNHKHYKLFKPGAFARELGLLHPEGPCLCQHAAEPSRSGSIEPGAWC